MDLAEACAVIERQRQVIQDLQRELGVRRRDGELGAIMQRLDVTATHARLLLTLYCAKGRVVGYDTLMAELSTPSQETLKVNICRIQKIAGEGLIYNMERTGYGLTPMGCGRLMAALEPVEMQPERGS
jgi:hypothetical protein